MAKSADDSVLDALLNEVDDNGVEIYICEGEPTTRAEAITNALHTGAIVRTPGKVIGAGAAGSRQYTDGPYPNETMDNVTATQTPDHVAVCSGALLLLVTTITGAPGITNNTVVDLNTWIHNVAQPT